MTEKQHPYDAMWDNLQAAHTKILEAMGKTSTHDGVFANMLARIVHIHLSHKGEEMCEDGYTRRYKDILATIKSEAQLMDMLPE